MSLKSSFGTQLCTSTICLLLVGSGGVFFPACGATAMPEKTVEEGYVLLEPSLDMVSPSAFSLGDIVTVKGKDFISAKNGVMSLYLDGTYVDSEGEQFPFTGEVPLKVLNDGIAEFSFDQLIFRPGHDKVGSWQGVAAVVNRTPNHGDETENTEGWSEGKDTTLTINPSIMFSRLRTADDSSCPSVSHSTVADQNIELGFKAIGFGKASVAHPWTVKFDFVTPDVEVRYVVPNAFDFWPVVGPLTNDVSVLAEEGNQSVEFSVDSGDLLIINPTTTERLVKVSPAVVIGQKSYDEVVLGSIIAGAVAENTAKTTTNFVVEMRKEDGRTLRRIVTMDVWSEIEVKTWNGSEEIVERYEPQSDFGCTAGGKIGLDFTYSERESESKRRAVSTQWNKESSESFGFDVGIKVFDIKSEKGWTESFGVDVSAEVSSSSEEGRAYKKFILPGHFGLPYRQLERYERRVDVIYHNACGQSGVVGQATLTNWKFAYDIGQGKECPPPSNLPPAEVF